MGKILIHVCYITKKGLGMVDIDCIYIHVCLHKDSLNRPHGGVSADAGCNATELNNAPF